MADLGLNRRDQIVLTLDEPLALARGVAAVAISIKAVGVLLISAFVVIPACVSRLVSHRFNSCVTLAGGLGAICAVCGLLMSCVFDLPSGHCVVIVQLLGFLAALLLSQPSREVVDSRRNQRR